MLKVTSILPYLGMEVFHDYTACIIIGWFSKKAKSIRKLQEKLQ